MSSTGQATSAPPEDLFGEVERVPERVTVATKLAELNRELGFRRRLYPKWVESGRLSAERADAQLRVLEAVLADYQVSAWPQTAQFVRDWREAAQRLTFLGVPVTRMHREELLAIVAYADAAIRAARSDEDER